MICKFCDKECKNYNSKRQHEVRCKFNPDALEIKSNFIAYNKKIKNGEIIKEFDNHYVKAEKCNLIKPIVSPETRKKLSIASKRQIWDDERKNSLSIIMTKVALEKPEIYSNKQKRTTEEYKGFKFDSPWELIVAKFLDFKDIKWTRPIKPIPYFWNNKWHLYFPDFYLLEEDTFIEVKGYETERDIAKWKAVEKLVVIKQKEIKQITSGNFVLVL